MHLLVIGHTAHYTRDGQIVGWGPTVKEVDWLARAFDQVTHLACYIPGPAPESALPYTSRNVDFEFVPTAGGRSLSQKLRVVTLAGKYIQAILKRIPQSDVIQVRTPGSLGMYGMLLLAAAGKRMRWTKYAGNWMEGSSIPPSFAFQRWWLKKGLTHGPVTINGRWLGQPAHLFTFDNPSLTGEEVETARRLTMGKALTTPVRLVFAGRLEAAKGVSGVLETVARLVKHREAHLDILGDGPQRQQYERQAADLGLGDNVTFHGWVPHDKVKRFLVEAHFMLLPSATEGWPKVLSEAMAYGVVPVASNVSAIPQILAETGAGFALSPSDINGYAQAIEETIQKLEMWQQMSQAGKAAAPRFTYARYLTALDEMLRMYYGSSPMKPEVIAAAREELAQTEAAVNEAGR